MLDLEMAALLRGGHRTEAEIEALLKPAGFQLQQVHATAVNDLQIVEAHCIAAA